MKNHILQIVKLGKSFGGLKLFNRVDLTLHRGTINSLFGNNGSGKTTFFNLIGGYEKPDAGKIYFNGMTIKFHKEILIAKAGVGRMWQDPTIFPNHTVLQNLLVSNKAHPGEYFFNNIFRSRAIEKKEEEIAEQAHKILKIFKLETKEKQIAGSLSFGEKKLLSISMLVMNDARLLMLDEPFSNVNPDTIERISEMLSRLKDEGKTIFIIEHKIKFAEAISDSLFKIENQTIHKYR